VPRSRIKEENFESSSTIHRKVSDDPDKDLFDKLKELRATLAQMQDVPPYIVFADTSLRQMAARKPRDKEELLKITGVGEYKLKKYGERFLKQITEHLETLEPASTSNENTAARTPAKKKTRTKVSQSAISKPGLKKEIVLRAMDQLEDDLIRSIKDKLCPTFYIIILIQISTISV